MLIDREKVSVPDVPKETMDVPELGGEIEVRGLMLNESLRCYSLSSQNDGRLDMAALLASTVYAADGKPLWTKEQWDSWGGVNASAAMRIASVSMRVSGLLKDDAEKKPETPSVSS